MITGSEIYWITRLDSLKVIPFIIATPPLVVGFMIWVKSDEPWSNIVRPSKYWFLALCLCFVTVFIPTTKEMCAIKIIPMVANQEDIKEIPANIADLANEWIEELKPNEDD